MEILHFSGLLLKGIMKRSLLTAVCAWYLARDLWRIAQPLMAMCPPSWRTAAAGHRWATVHSQPITGPEGKVREEVESAKPSAHTPTHQPVPPSYSSAVWERNVLGRYKTVKLSETPPHFLGHILQHSSKAGKACLSSPVILLSLDAWCNLSKQFPAFSESWEPLIWFS